MRMPKSVTQQSAQLPTELSEEAKTVRSLFRFGEPQTAEYTAAAKALNAKLRDAGFTALLVVEG